MRDELYYEEELSLYDILDVVLKYKKGILSILVCGCLLSLGAALVARSYRKEYTQETFAIHYSELQDNVAFRSAKVPFEKFDVHSVLEDTVYLDRFLALPVLQKLYEKAEIPKDRFELQRKRDFLANIISITTNEDKESRIQVTLPQNESGAEEILDCFFAILEEEIPLSLEKKILAFKAEVQSIQEEAHLYLESLQPEIQKILSNKNIVSSDNLLALVSVENPVLAAEQESYRVIYEASSKRLLALSYLLENKEILKEVIHKNPDILVEVGPTKAKMVLAIGVLLSAFLAFAYVALQEMKLGYEEHKREKMLTKK